MPPPAPGKGLEPLSYKPRAPKRKEDDPSDISHSKAPIGGYTQQFVPYGPQGDQRPIPLKPSGRGGGGGYDPYAAQRAADERRKAAMRAAIEQQYGTALGSLGDLNQQTQAGLGEWYGQAQGRMNPIYDQNQALTGQYAQQLASMARDASQGVISQGDMLARDLESQGGGYGLGDLRGVIGTNVEDILGARGAADQYNTRLGQVMGTNRADNSALLSAILQAAQSQRENAYTSQYNQLTAEQARALAELA